VWTREDAVVVNTVQNDPKKMLEGKNKCHGKEKLSKEKYCQIHAINLSFSANLSIAS
jgi:hypothetical protein